METLSKQVRRAEGRLMVRTFVRVLPWCLCVTLLAAALLIGVDKFRPLGIQPWPWTAGAFGVGLLAAAVWTFLARRGSLDAAVEIDRRFGLRERVSSTLALNEEQRGTPAGKALVADAIKRVERVHVAERFKLWSWSWSWLSLGVPAAAFALALLLNPATGDNPAEGNETVLSRQEITKEARLLRKKLIERRKKARDLGLKDAERVFEKIEQGAKQLANNSAADRKKALVKLNDFAKQLEKRRAALGGSKKIKDQLNNLKGLKRGPADKFAEAMKDGDFRNAMKELKNLRDQLEAGKLDSKAKKQLADQLEAMQSKLKKMADAHKKAMEDLKKQIEQKKQSGDKAAARKLQKQLDKLAQQAGQMNKMNDLAKQLGECAQCLKNGQQEAAMEGIEGLEAQLADLQKQLDELELLDAAMDELAECKNCLNGMGRGRSNQRGGRGLGECEGSGDRPLDRGNTGNYASRVRQKVGKGDAVVTELVDGKNIKGEVQQQIKTEIESARSDAADPLTGQKLPRSVQDHAREYFNKLRDGQ